MASRPDFSHTAKLMAHPSRAAMLDALLGTDGLPASELAREANITLQTASEHLGKLVEGKMVRVEKHGRHRYFRLASLDVARAIESLTVIAPSVRVSSLKDAGRVKRIHMARTCYDHLAGKLGVSLTDSLLKRKYIMEGQDDFLVSEDGERFFREFGIDLDTLRKKRRFFARKCLDWSERRYHLAGSLGNAVLERLLALGWVEKQAERTVRVTEKGATELEKTFGNEICLEVK
ncbi:MAG TPA: helix-turn-helix domain-containing protein [Bacillales bacterium]|nr:helix-turn-helix domain-containing protein [Bacillales bacterium]